MHLYTAFQFINIKIIMEKKCLISLSIPRVDYNNEPIESPLLLDKRK